MTLLVCFGNIHVLYSEDYNYEKNTGAVVMTSSFETYESYLGSLLGSGFDAWSSFGSSVSYENMYL